MRLIVAIFGNGFLECFAHACADNPAFDSVITARAVDFFRHGLLPPACLLFMALCHFFKGQEGNQFPPFVSRELQEDARILGEFTKLLPSNGDD
jgi:hypothetical protein